MQAHKHINFYYSIVDNDTFSYIRISVLVLGAPSDQSSGTSSPLCDSGLHLNYHPNNTVRAYISFMKLHQKINR